MPESIPESIPESMPESMPESTSIKIKIPKIIFIVPYRDRQQQQQFFASHMKTVMEDFQKDDYKIYYLHQNDKREFNRGAMKNAGFLIVREKYPNDYKDITLIFNDVDTMPFTKNFLNYETTIGNVKHFYGFEFTLGGIVSIKAGDFEKTLGFPNFWAWGYEDNLLQKRVLSSDLKIDRSEYYKIMDPNIYQMKDGLTRLVNRKEFESFLSNTKDGYNDLSNLEYTINEDTGFIDIHRFDTPNKLDTTASKIHDIRSGSKPFGEIKSKSIKSSRFSMF
jgi:hypothetical protein